MQAPASGARLPGAWRGVPGVAAVGWGGPVFLLGTGLGTREEKAGGWTVLRRVLWGAGLSLRSFLA